jgi:uncharacterized protein YqeY
MKDPRPQLQEALKDAMKNGDKARRDVIRVLQSAIKQVEVDTRKDLSAEDVVAVLQKEVKMRRESIDEMESSGRTEHLQQTRDEVEIIQAFLPEQLSHDEIKALVQQIIADTGAESARDTGKVMAALMPQIKGRADGTLASQVVRELLS